jgi:hypothetical protein
MNMDEWRETPFVRDYIERCGHQEEEYPDLFNYVFSVLYDAYCHDDIEWWHNPTREHFKIIDAFDWGNAAMELDLDDGLFRTIHRWLENNDLPRFYIDGEWRAA